MKKDLDSFRLQVERTRRHTAACQHSVGRTLETYFGRRVTFFFPERPFSNPQISHEHDETVKKRDELLVVHKEMKMTVMAASVTGDEGPSIEHRNRETEIRRLDEEVVRLKEELAETKERARLAEENEQKARDQVVLTEKKRERIKSEIVEVQADKSGLMAQQLVVLKEMDEKEEEAQRKSPEERKQTRKEMAAARLRARKEDEHADLHEKIAKREAKSRLQSDESKMAERQLKKIAVAREEAKVEAGVGVEPNGGWFGTTTTTSIAPAEWTHLDAEVELVDNMEKLVEKNVEYVGTGGHRPLNDCLDCCEGLDKGLTELIDTGDLEDVFGVRDQVQKLRKFFENEEAEKEKARNAQSESGSAGSWAGIKEKIQLVRERLLGQKEAKRQDRGTHLDEEHVLMVELEARLAPGGAGRLGQKGVASVEEGGGSFWGAVAGGFGVSGDVVGNGSAKSSPKAVAKEEGSSKSSPKVFRGKMPSPKAVIGNAAVVAAFYPEDQPSDFDPTAIEQDAGLLADPTGRWPLDTWARFWYEKNQLDKPIRLVKTGKKNLGDAPMPSPPPKIQDTGPLLELDEHAVLLAMQILITLTDRREKAMSLLNGERDLVEHLLEEIQSKRKALKNIDSDNADTGADIFTQVLNRGTKVRYLGEKRIEEMEEVVHFPPGADIDSVVCIVVHVDGADTLGLLE